MAAQDNRKTSMPDSLKVVSDPAPGFKEGKIETSDIPGNEQPTKAQAQTRSATAAVDTTEAEKQAAVADEAAKAEAAAAAAIAEAPPEETFGRVMSRLGDQLEKMGGPRVDLAKVREARFAPEQVPAKPIQGHAIVELGEFSGRRRQIPTAAIMDPRGCLIECGGQGREIPAGLMFDMVQSGQWKVIAFSPHPRELLTLSNGDSHNGRYFKNADKYKLVDGVFWHPQHVSEAKKA